MGTQSTLANGWLQLNGKYWPSRRRRLCSIDQNCRANKVQLYSPAAVSVLLKVVLYGITRPTADQTQTWAGNPGWFPPKKTCVLNFVSLSFVQQNEKQKKIKIKIKRGNKVKEGADSLPAPRTDI